MRLLQLHNAPFFSLVLCSAVGMISPLFERIQPGAVKADLLARRADAAPSTRCSSSLHEAVRFLNKNSCIKHNYLEWWSLFIG
ncbi:hypothetical protein [uncultured Desulfovibrio sp.]|nr:hypothetical protein [uncultured Desulfovibrio sp.]